MKYKIKKNRRKKKRNRKNKNKKKINKRQGQYHLYFQVNQLYQEKNHYQDQFQDQNLQ